jgi:hypothetical protein
MGKLLTWVARFDWRGIGQLGALVCQPDVSHFVGGPLAWPLNWTTHQPAGQRPASGQGSREAFAPSWSAGAQPAASPAITHIRPMARRYIPH